MAVLVFFLLALGYITGDLFRAPVTWAIAMAFTGLIFYANRVTGEAQEERLADIEKKLDTIVELLKDRKKDG
jgi:hypothetical protein